MRILDRYIGQAVLVNFGIVMLVLMALFFFSEMANELKFIGQHDYSFINALVFSLKLLPRQTYELFPLGALLGTLLGLGSLANNSELTVIRAAGISVRQVIFSVFKVGLLLMLGAVLIGEFVAPDLEKQGRIQRAQQLKGNISFGSDSGAWSKEGDTIYRVQRLLPSGLAVNVSLYRFDEQRRLVEIASAPRARYTDKGWELIKLRKSLISEEGVVSEYHKSAPWQTAFDPEVIEIVALPPENLPIADIYNFISYLKDNDLDASQYELAFWVRVFIPFATAGMVLLAIPFVFGSMRSVPIGQRITTGVLLGLGFYLFNAVFNRLGLIFDLSPLLSAALPTLIVFLLWGWMMRRVS